MGDFLRRLLTDLEGLGLGGSEKAYAPHHTRASFGNIESTPVGNASGF